MNGWANARARAVGWGCLPATSGWVEICPFVVGEWCPVDMVGKHFPKQGIECAMDGWMVGRVETECGRQGVGMERKARGEEGMISDQIV